MIVQTRHIGSSEYELATARFAVACLIAAGTVIGLLGGRPEIIAVTSPLTLALYALAAVTWLWARWWPSQAFWVTIGSVATAVLLVHSRIGLPVLGLLAILPILATALPSRWAVAVAAIASSTVLALYGLGAGVRTTEWGAAVVLIWVIAAATLLAGIPARNLVRWSWDHYVHNQRLLDEARNQRGEYLQTLDDLAQANRQLVLLNERLAIARRTAEEAERAKADFVANVSHELRTPLNMIIGLTDLMMVKPDVYGTSLPRLMAEDLQIVHRNCEHLASLINDVLDLSRIEAERMSLRMEHVKFAEVVERAADIVLPLIRKKGLEFRLELPDEELTVYCDRTRIRQVIVNLVSNAARLTEHGGIRVGLIREEQDVVVSVADTGPGIAETDIHHIFEPFFSQSDANRQWRGMGSGLGLSISKQFVDLHRGQIYVQSQMGTGSTFTVRLPMRPPDEPSSGVERWLTKDWEWLARTGKSNAAVERGSIPVVVCDQTGEYANTLAAYASDIEFHVTHQLNAALEATQLHHPSALVINSSSPQDLYPLVAEAAQRASDLPVIGFAAPGGRQLARLPQALDYLVKPVRQADMLEAIGKVDGDGLRVLIVDDDSDTQRLFMRYLNSIDKVAVVDAAMTGGEALEALRSEVYDLVLLDVVLPDMDGYAVMEAARLDETVRDVPVIIVSAQNITEQPVRSPVVMAALGDGLPLGRMLQLVKALPGLLIQSE